jgi:hypothetical protein
MEPNSQEEKPCEARPEGLQGREKLSQVIQIDEGKIRAHLREVVRSAVDKPHQTYSSTNAREVLHTTSRYIS